MSMTVPQFQDARTGADAGAGHFNIGPFIHPLGFDIGAREAAGIDIAGILIFSHIGSTLT